MHAVVIGQGAAGLTAALVLAQQGVEVTSISKTQPGKATSTIYSGGGFTLGVGGLSPDEHKNMTLRTGRNLNAPELLEIFTQEAPSIVTFLRESGVPFAVHHGGISLQKDPSFPLLGGKSLIDALYKMCVHSGVNFLPNAIVTRLLTDCRGICGIEWLQRKTKEISILSADSVVMATGGGGAMYERTDNPPRITGDGYMLALHTGCHLVDMEFVQFYPIGIDVPGGAHWFIDLGIIDIARLTDTNGEPFLDTLLKQEGLSSGRDANLFARDKCSVAIALQNKKSQAFLHLEDIPKESWENDEYLRTIMRMFPKSSPPWQNPVPVSPIQHYFPGGIRIGPNAETEVPGLFACGEVTGGVDGANRVGGNALTNCIVFGIRAGKSAAAYAKGMVPPSMKRVEEVCADEVRVPASIIPRVTDWLNNKGSTVSPRYVRESIQEYSSKYLLPVRSGKELIEAKERLYALSELIGAQRAESEAELLLAAENVGLWHTAASVTFAAYAREESRGPHFRTDFPEENPIWERNIYIRMA